MKSALAKLLVSLLAVLFVASAWGAKKYTMADLEALAKQESWQEMVEHLIDIAPSERNAAWQSLLEKAAIGYVKTSPKAGNNASSDTLLKNFPTLKQSADFMAAHLASFSECYQNRWEKVDCTNRIIQLVEANPGDAQLAMKAGQIIARNVNVYESVSAFRFAVKTKRNGETCKNETVQRSVIGAMGLPDGDMVQHAQEIAEHCFDQMKDNLIEKMGSETGYYLKNACVVLRKKNALTGLKAKRCDRATSNG